MKKNCIIVIPVYKPLVSKSERQAFVNNIVKLKAHDITLATYSGCDLTSYKEFALEYNVNIGIKYFAEHYFKSVDSYNSLCLSKDFYITFAEYDYMLICQLDAWVFSDELDYWCGQGYDYVGAPLYYGYNDEKFSVKFRGVGNGGFCLRRIDHCLKVLSQNRKIPYLKPLAVLSLYKNLYTYHDNYTQNWIKKFIDVPKIILKLFGITNTLGYFISQHNNEDMIFGTWANDCWLGTANIPDELTAARFSLETNAQRLYNMNGCKLPFGCHAYEKWNDNGFWNDKIIYKW